MLPSKSPHGVQNTLRIHKWQPHVTPWASGPSTNKTRLRKLAHLHRGLVQGSPLHRLPSHLALRGGRRGKWALPPPVALHGGRDVEDQMQVREDPRAPELLWGHRYHSDYDATNLLQSRGQILARYKRETHHDFTSYPDMKFQSIITGWPGKMSDAMVLQSSSFFDQCKKGEKLNRPCVFLSKETELSEYIVGDKGYLCFPGW